MDRIPLIVYGDGPRLHSGLARIARDVAIRLVAEADDLGIRFAQVGVDYPGGWQWQSWDFCGFQPTQQDQGREAVEAAVFELTQETGCYPVVFMVMDPARCWDLTREAPRSPEDRSPHRLGCHFWGYFPLDSHNRQEAVGGPALRCIQDCDRLLAYGRYGARLLRNCLRTLPHRDGDFRAAQAVSYLPHGLDLRVFRPGVPLTQADGDFIRWAQTVPPDAIKIGCVATNQPRKDLGLLIETVAAIRSAGHAVALWLHTDLLTKAWDVGELVSTCGLARQEIAVSTHELTDPQLVARYNWSDVTIAPGLGEGFGYPIVESLACGTPVVHGRYAGGIELVPHPAWLLDPVAWRLESVYALKRPVFSPDACAAAVIDTYHATQHDPAQVHAYCSGAVEYLDWKHLWPRWRSWFHQGLMRLQHPIIEKTVEELRDISNGTRRSPQPA